MPDLFTRTEVDFGGAMHGQFGIMSRVAGVEIGILLQNIQLQYSQQVTRIYELGTTGRKTRVFYISGRAQGQLTAAHVIGPGVALRAYYNRFGDVCNAGNNNVDINLGPNVCPTGTGRLAYKMKYCVLVQIGMSTQAQDFVISENSQLIFSGLEYNGT